MSKVLDEFILPLRESFDDPYAQSDKNDALFIRLDGALNHFSSSTLTQAVLRLQNMWKYQKFPPQAVCVEACIDIHEKKVGQNTQYPVIEINSAEWDAWEHYYRSIAPHKARLMNASTRGSWTVPTLWPPGHVKKKEGENV